MKVTVCFSDVKVVVPCGDGSGLVKDLLEEAITRYRKAQAKSSDACWLDLNTVKLLLCDGGILDLDDKITDVIDDKEQIQAVVDGNNNRSLQEHNDSGGDGMSGSSLGTYSPDIFRDNLSDRLCNGKETSDSLVDGCHDVIITEQDFLAESGLRVRRGSEPTLHTSSDLDSSGVELSAEYPIYGAVKKNAGDRQEPLGSILKLGHSGNPGHVVAVKPTTNTDAKISKEQEHEQSDKEMVVVLPKSTEALGIHVVPEFDQSGRNIGLMIEKIERGGRADRDRRLLRGDKIIEINFQNLFQVDFPKAQDIFRSAFLAPELQIRLLRPSKQNVKSSSEDKDRGNSASVLDRFEQKHLDATKRIPPAVPARSPKTQLTSKAPARLTMQAIPIELIKGANGLGFSVTMHGIRDSGCCPIYIKNIFSVGAAIEDGRLKPGDVLLEINGTSLANKTKADAVRLLRNLPTGSAVQLLVSRALSLDETALQKVDLNGRPASQRQTIGLRSTSASSCSDRTEEEEEDVGEEDKEPEDLGAKENAAGIRKFGSMSNIAKSGSSDDFDDQADHVLALNLQTGGHSADKLGTLSTLQKSRKSISMDDLRRNARSGVEVSFDDDVDFAVAPFHKMRDFNQSFRAAVIDKTGNKPPTGVGTQSAEYIAAIEKLERLEKLEKLRADGDKKNKSKKDRGGGSGRKFGWLFRFGKGRKSDSENSRSAPSQAANLRNSGDKVTKPSAHERSSANGGLPVTGPTSVSLHQPPSHLSVHSHYPEPFRETDGGLVRLQKEDYMISSSGPSRQAASNQDRSQKYTKHTNTDFVYNEPQSYRHQQELDYQLYEQSRQHEGMSDRYDPLKQQQLLRSPTSHRYQQLPVLGSSNAYLNQAYPETSAPSQQFRHQGIPPPGGDGRPPFKYHRDNYPGLRPYTTDFYPEQHPRYAKPSAGEPSQQPSARSGHYYRQENFQRPDPVSFQDFQMRHNPYFHDPAYDQRPLDLSQHAVRAQDVAEVGYGHGSREHGLHNRHIIGSDIKIPNQQTSVYPPYKDVNPGGLKASSDMAREQAMQQHMKTRAMAEQRQYNADYQARLRQKNQTFITERW